MKGTYLVALDSSYARDTQIFTRPLKEDEDHGMSDDWRDSEVPLILNDNVAADSMQEAINYVATSQDVCPDYLFAYELKPSS